MLREYTQIAINLKLYGHQNELTNVKSPAHSGALPTACDPNPIVCCIPISLDFGNSCFREALYRGSGEQECIWSDYYMHTTSCF